MRNQSESESTYGAFVFAIASSVSVQSLRILRTLLLAVLLAPEMNKGGIEIGKIFEIFAPFLAYDSEFIGSIWETHSISISERTHEFSAFGPLSLQKACQMDYKSETFSLISHTFMQNCVINLIFCFLLRHSRPFVT